MNYETAASPAGDRGLDRAGRPPRGHRDGPRPASRFLRAQRHRLPCLRLRHQRVPAPGGTEWIRRKDVTLLLQPQSKIGELQTWLRDNGFAAEKARLAKDGGRIYLILCVRWDGSRRPDDPFFLGLLAGDALRGAYAAQLLRKTEKQLLAFRDGRGDPEKERILAETCRLLKEASAAVSGNTGD